MPNNEKDATTLHTSLKKEFLLTLNPLCSDIPWMKELISYLDNVAFPDTLFELTGLARKICYEINLAYPHLYAHTHFAALKNWLNDSLDEIKVKRTKDPFSKIIERIIHETKTEMHSKKSPF